MARCVCVCTGVCLVGLDVLLRSVVQDSTIAVCVGLTRLALHSCVREYNIRALDTVILLCACGNIRFVVWLQLARD